MEIITKDISINISFYTLNKPRMLFNFLKRESFPWIWIEYLFYQVSYFKRQSFFFCWSVLVFRNWNIENYFLFIVFFIIEWFSSCENIEKDDSTTPDIRKLSIISLILNNFRCHITDSTACSVIQIWSLHYKV